MFFDRRKIENIDSQSESKAHAFKATDDISAMLLSVGADANTVIVIVFCIVKAFILCFILLFKAFEIQPDLKVTCPSQAQRDAIVGWMFLTSSCFVLFKVVEFGC